MGDAEYMYANGLDPFGHYASKGYEEWDNPLYREERPSRSTYTRKAHSARRSNHLNRNTIYYKDGVGYRWAGYSTVPGPGDIYLYDRHPNKLIVARGAGNAINEWPVLEEAE